MKKVLFCMLAVALVFSIPVFAQDQGGFGLRVAYFSPAEDGIDNGYGVGLDYLIPFSGSDFNMEIALDYYMAEDETGTVDFDVMPLTFTARWQPAVNEVFYPYLGAGLGYYFASQDLDQWYLDEYDIDDSVSDFGYHLVAGFDYKSGEGAWSAELKWAACEIGDWYDSDVGGIALSAGYRFTF